MPFFYLPEISKNILMCDRQNENCALKGIVIFKPARFKYVNLDAR